nr:NAD(P)/FAD-dependent oxidoreductase [Vallicoccus soli]
MWDLVVVGAGPAGSAAALGALTARPRARVLLLDRADFPRDKPCGDGIAPHALDVLARLGVHGVVDGYRPVAGLRLAPPAGAPVAGRMARPAHVVPRRVLDARLVAAATARGAVLERRRVRSLVREVGRVLVDGEVAARAVVGADGAHSVVRRLVGAGEPGRVALALRGYAPVAADAPDAQVIAFGPGAGPTYAWSFPVGDGRANVGYGTVLGTGPAPTRQGLLDGLERLLPGAGAGGRDWRAHHLPLSSHRPRQPDGPVLLAGDALSLVNPVTGEGIYYAVLSGALAGAAAVRPGDPGRAYRRSLDRALGRHLRHTALAARIVARPRLLAAGLAASGRDGRAFDDLVELGLGGGTLTPRVLGGTLRALVPG